MKKGKSEIIRLRGHHLICLHFFSGEGYSRDFTENLKVVLRMAKEEVIEIREGPDDICKKCPYLKSGKCLFDEDAEEEIREMDKKALNLLKLSPGRKIKWDEIEKGLPEIFREWSESYCGDCDWRWACEKKVSYQELKNKFHSKSF
ncbi:MAG: DUF1284 domain-containing protein [Nitrospirota bacterium]